MGRQVVEDDADEVGLGVVEVGELAHALGEVAGGMLGGDLDLAPGAVGIEEDEQIDRDRKSTRLNSSHIPLSRMPSSA